MQLVLAMFGNAETEPYAVEAKPSDGVPDRVEFYVDGPVMYRSEGAFPYSLFGDAGVGKLTRKTLGKGQHVIEARAIKAGLVVATASLSFTEGPPAPVKTAAQRATEKLMAATHEPMLADEAAAVVNPAA